MKNTNENHDETQNTQNVKINKQHDEFYGDLIEKKNICLVRNQARLEMD